MSAMSDASPRIDDYAYWTAAKAGQAPEYHEDAPQCGFYRIRNADGSYDPVAIWRNADGVIACKRGSSLVGDSINDVWRLCAQRPVEHGVYMAVTKDGTEWPDVVKMPTIGHNSEDEIPLSTKYKEAVSEKLAEYGTWLKSIGGKIATRDQADRADAFKAVISKLRTEGEKERVKEKEPHLTAGRDVDKRWADLKTDAERAEKKIAEAIKPYLLEQDRIRCAAEEAARQKIVEMRKAEDAARNDAPLDAGHVLPDPEPVFTTAPVKVGSGRGTRLRDRQVVVIVDPKQVEDAYAKTQNFQRAAREWAAANAIALNDAGAPIPGTRIDIEKEVA